MPKDLRLVNYEMPLHICGKGCFYFSCVLIQCLSRYMEATDLSSVKNQQSSETLMPPDILWFICVAERSLLNLPTTDKVHCKQGNEDSIWTGVCKKGDICWRIEFLCFSPGLISYFVLLSLRYVLLLCNRSEHVSRRAWLDRRGVGVAHVNALNLPSIVF